jgi:hypothetical protein
MAEQNLKNHTRYIPLWHIICSFLLLVGLGGSIVNLVHADAATHYSAALLVLIFIILLIIFWYARWFAIRAQDRAIRAEESLRHFILTGKPIDKQLRLGQIIALRFASDEELPALAKKAVAENLSSKAIKESISNWRADNHRV